MLQHLVEYALRHDLETEPGFAPKNARWAIRLSGEGKLLGVVEIGELEAKRNPGQRFHKAPELSQPELKAGGTAKSHFLIEAAQVVALWGKDADDPKVAAKHVFFVGLLREASAAMPDLALAANALEDAECLAKVQASLGEQKARPTDKVTFWVAGAYPVESDAWHDWWREKRTEFHESPKAREAMVSFVSGKAVEPAPTHPKVRGLGDVGGIAMGSPLIGFDKKAFESYHLSQSANCAVSEEDAACYRAALDDLIGKHSQRLAGTRVVHWYKMPVAQSEDPMAIAWDPSFAWEQEEGVQEADAQRRARELLTAIRDGRKPDLAANQFFALTVSGAAGRVMVRDWMEGTFEELAGNVAAWFSDLEIVRREGGACARWPKFAAVLAATTRVLDDLAPPLVASMWRAAVRDEAIPRAALAQSVLRFRADLLADEPAKHARMGLMKAYHLRKDKGKGGDDVSSNLGPYLNEDHPSLAYHCGRLMAVMAQLQRSALGDVGAGLVQRYYAAASATPALVLGRLARTGQFHLNKIQGDSPGLARWYEDKLAGIWGRLHDVVPQTLDLEGQSLFALGYYQQLADLRTKKTEAPAGATGDDLPEGESDDE